MFKRLLQMLAMSNMFKMGIVDDGAGEGETDEEKAMKQLGGIVEKAVMKATKEVEEKSAATIKKLNEKLDANEKETAKIKAFAQTSDAATKQMDNLLDDAVVKIFGEVKQASTVSETEFVKIKEAVGQKVLAEGDLTPGTDSNAGINVFEKFEKDLIYEIEKFDVIKTFKNINLAKGTKITWTIATNGIIATFVDEKGLPTESEPTFDPVSIDVKKIIALITITQELEEDQMTTPQLYRLIVEFGGEAIAELIEKEALGWDGTAFVGIFNLPGALTDELPAGKTVSDSTRKTILNIEQKLNHKERAKAEYFMSDYARYEIGAVENGLGNPVFPNVFDKNPTLFGRKLNISDYGAEVQDETTNVAGNSYLALGNPKQYLIVHRTGVTIDKGFYGDKWAREQASIKIRKRWGMGSLKDTAFVIASNGA